MAHRKAGFTVIELFVVMAMMVIIAGIAIPNFWVMIENYRLKSATMDVYTNLQFAKMTAIRKKADCTITFSVDANQYAIDIDGQTLKTVELQNYGSGVKLQAPEGEEFTANTVTYNSIGLTTTVNSTAFLKNNRNLYYKVSIYSTGAIKYGKEG